MTKFNSMFDIAFSVEHNYTDPYDIPVEILIFALEKRLMDIKKRVLDGEKQFGEEFGLCDTYTVDMGD